MEILQDANFWIGVVVIPTILVVWAVMIAVVQTYRDKQDAEDRGVEDGGDLELVALGLVNELEERTQMLELHADLMNDQMNEIIDALGIQEEEKYESGLSEEHEYEDLGFDVRENGSDPIEILSERELSEDEAKDLARILDRHIKSIKKS